MKKSKNNSVISDEMPFGRIPFEEIQFGQGSSEEISQKETPSKENSSEEFSFDHILSDEMPFGRIPFEEIQFGQSGPEEASFEEPVSEETLFGRIPFEEIQFGQNGPEEVSPDEQISEETSFGRIPFEEIQFGQNESGEASFEEPDEEPASEQSLLEELRFNQTESEEMPVEELSPDRSESEEIRFYPKEPEKVLFEETLSDESLFFEQGPPDEEPSRVTASAKAVLHAVWPGRKKAKRAQSEPVEFYSWQEEQISEFEEETPPDVFFDDTVDQENNKQGWLRFLIELAIVIVAVLFIFNVIIGISQVSGDSMYPAFQEKDRILYFRLAQNFEKGDIILIRQKDGTKLIKRVVATEGDSLYIDKRDKSVYIDGQLLNEDYVYSNTEITDDSIEYPVVIEEGHVFVMGDNREVSEDSRNAGIGQISKEQITGKVFFLFRHVGKSE